MTFDNPGPLPELKWLPKNVFAVDRHYQRGTDSERSQAVIARITKKFAWARFQPPTVTPGPKGKYIVIDGQHRIQAAIARSDITDIPVYIVPELSRDEQAANFVAINRDRVGLHPLTLHHAMVAMGDTNALAIKAVCDEADIKIARQPAPCGNTKPRETAAIGTIKIGLDKYDEAVVIASLMIIPEAYKLVPGMLRSRTLKALMAFYRGRGVRHVDRDALIRVLKAKSPVNFEAEATVAARARGETPHLVLIEMISAAYDQAVKMTEGAGV